MLKCWCIGCMSSCYRIIGGYVSFQVMCDLLKVFLTMHTMQSNMELTATSVSSTNQNCRTTRLTNYRNRVAGNGPHNPQFRFLSPLLFSQEMMHMCSASSFFKQPDTLHPISLDRPTQRFKMKLCVAAIQDKQMKASKFCWILLARTIRHLWNVQLLQHIYLDVLATISPKYPASSHKLCFGANAVLMLQNNEFYIPRILLWGLFPIFGFV